MEEGMLSQLIDWVQANPGWVMLAAFAFAFLESLAIIGVFVPGILLLFAVGALVGMDLTGLVLVWLAASTGALAGDGISFWFGHHYRHRLPHMWPLNRHPQLLAQAQTYFVQHGGKSVFAGRFIGPLRPLIPMMAGMLSMRRRDFALIATPACLLWAPLYLAPGVLFGASLELAAEFAGRLVVVLLIVVLGSWFMLWLTRGIYEFTARRSTWWLKGLVRWSTRHAVMGRLIGSLIDPSRREVLSVTLLGLLLGLSMAGLLAVLVFSPFGTPAWDIDRQLAGLAASLRNHFADPVFVALSLAGDLRVMALLAGLMTILMIVIGRQKAAWHWLIATAGGWLLAELLNGFMGLVLDRPDAAMPLAEIPHRSFSLATVVLGFFAVMIAKDLSARRRKWPYLATVLLLSLIGFAHFYLGRASISGLLAATALGCGWLALVGIGYRQRAIPRRRPLLLVMVFYLLLASFAAVHIGQTHTTLTEQTRLAYPDRQLSLDQWLTSDWELLPAKRSRIGREFIQRFDLQLAGRLIDIERALAGHGWHVPEAPGRRGIVGMLAGDPDDQPLPHFQRDFAGQPERLLMVRAIDGSQMLVIRLWHSGAVVGGTEAPIWLGQVRVVEPASWLGFNHWQQIYEETEAAAEQLRRDLDTARWRQARVGLWLGKL